VEHDRDAAKGVGERRRGVGEIDGETPKLVSWTDNQASSGEAKEGKSSRRRQAGEPKQETVRAGQDRE
jgi:hypothetical protein